MFIMVMFTGILASMMYYYSIPPQQATNLYDVPSPTQSPQESKAEVFGNNLVVYHKAAVRYMAVNPSYLGTIAEQDIRNNSLLPGNYQKMGQWTSLAADTGGGGRAVFTYPAQNPAGVTSGMMVSGMARANGFGWGTGVARQGKMVDSIVQATVPNAKETSQGHDAVKHSTVIDRPDVSVPAAIPENTAFQMTQIK